LSRRRFFVDAIEGGIAVLRGDDARHLTRVLRVEPGQVYEISDNASAWLAEIVEARGERAVFRVLEPLESPLPPVRITLCQALVKFDRFEWIVEKATELGVEQILPVETARTEKGLFEASRKRAERWQRIARESSQQSRRVTMPEILPAVRYEKMLAMDTGYRFFFDEETSPPALNTLPAARVASDRLAVLIGPEGGWTEAERAAALASGWQTVSLGSLVLRAETAATAALAVISAAWSASS
jgi:16S rRNA (uracil1498-N3)-methyltransferase